MAVGGEKASAASIAPPMTAFTPQKLNSTPLAGSVSSSGPQSCDCEQAGPSFSWLQGHSAHSLNPMMQDYTARLCSSANCLSLSARFLCDRWAFLTDCTARMETAPCSERRRPAHKLKPAAHPPAPPAGTPRHPLPHGTWPDPGPGSPPAARRPCPLLARTAAAPLGAPARTCNSTGDKTVVYFWTLPFGTRGRAVLCLTQSRAVCQLCSVRALYRRAQLQHHRVRLCTSSAHSPFIFADVEMYDRLLAAQGS